MSSKETKKEELFEHVASNDFLKFAFNGASYEASLQRAIHRTGRLCAISVTERTLSDGRKVIWMAHDFKFLGGSLGTAEGEKLVLGFERGLQKRIPVVVECRSGGARMQEGTQSLMQMAKISVAVRALRSVQPAVPFISVLQDPTYGGVSASYAMQSDVRIGVKDARIGFAGPSVILDTMYEKNQDAYVLYLRSLFFLLLLLCTNTHTHSLTYSLTHSPGTIVRHLVTFKEQTFFKIEDSLMLLWKRARLRVL
jgi:acetyl-CoA carboxylase carboxyl transferase subunit beta